MGYSARRLGGKLIGHIAYEHQVRILDFHHVFLPAVAFFRFEPRFPSSLKAS